MKEWFAKVKSDFLKKEFMPLKVLFFFMIGGMTTLFPYLTIQARSLGIKGQELGLIYSFLPVVGVCGPSCAGLLADKIGNFKFLLSGIVALSGFAGLLFLIIPPARIQHRNPSELPMVVNCSRDENTIHALPPFTCNINNFSINTNLLIIENCFLKCSQNSQLSSLIRKNILTNWCYDKPNCVPLDELSIKSVEETRTEIRNFSYDKTKKEENNLYYFLNRLKITDDDDLIMNFNNLSLPLSLITDKEGKDLHNSFCPEALQTEENEKCYMLCTAFVNSVQFCSNEKSTETLNVSLTIVAYIIVRLFNSLTLATSFTLFNGAVVAIMKEYNGDLGLQSLYGNVGAMVMTPLSGFLIDYYSKTFANEVYAPSFILYCVIKLICACLFLLIDLNFKQPSNRILKDFKELMMQPRVSTFIIFVLIAGTSYGFIETFLFWLLEDLGADKSLMGITVTVGATFGIPLLFSSTYLIEKLGHVNVLLVCMFFYVVRLVGYSLITNPWYAMPFEMMEGITTSLMAVTCMSFAGVLSKPSTVASLQGLYSGTFQGAGRGLGSLAGGIMIKNLGNSLSFQTLAGSCAIGGILYFLVNKFFLGDLQIEENEKKEKYELQNAETANKEKKTDEEIINHL